METEEGIRIRCEKTLIALLQEVRAGASFVIVDKGIPVAQLTPLLTPEEQRAAAIDVSNQSWRPALASAPEAAWRQLALGKPAAGTSAVEALLDERRSSR